MTQELRTAVRFDMAVQNGDGAFDTSAEVAALIEANTATGQFAKIWQFTVPAQQAFMWGYGGVEGQRNQGFMHFAAVDEGTGFEDGLLRLILSDANERNRRVITTLNTVPLHTTTSTTAITATPTSIDSKTPLPLQLPVRVGEDSLMILEFQTLVATTTVDAATFIIPATQFTRF
jgi:hypothetical protein